MNLELNLVVVALFATATTSLSIAIFSWRRRGIGEWAVPFTALALAVTVWTFFYALEVASVSLAAKIFFAKIEYIGIVSVSVTWFIFSLQYTGRGKWLTRARAYALLVIPLMTVVVVFTNEIHGWNWASTSLNDAGPIIALDTTYGFWFWVPHSLYSYSITLLGTIFVVQAYWRYPPAYRRQNATLLAGVTLPFIANVLFVLGLLPFPSIDLTTLAFTLSCVLIANAIFRYQLFDIVPVARRSVVDNMQDGMIVLDRQNRVVDINPAALKLFRQEANAMIGYRLGEFMQEQSAIIDSFRDVTEAQTELPVMVDGRQLVFDLHISPVKDASGLVNGRLIIFHDITLRKEAELAVARSRDEALQVSQFKSELLARVSHELRTPLNVILGYTEMLQEGIFGPITAEQWEPTDKIIESTAFLAKQVNELLDLSKLEVGHLSVNKEPLDISEVIQRVQARMQILAAAKQIDLRSDVHQDVPPVIMSDADRIEQILLNLVGNAIKFSHNDIVKQTVFLPDAAHWALQVSDHGIGIPEDMQQMIFEPFKQVDGSPTRLHSGTGLGLAIVRQMTDLLGGEIILESEVGKGSTFTIQFPLDSDEP